MQGIPSFSPLCRNSGRSSVWDDGLPPPRAAYPELKRDEPPLVPAWPCSWQGLPGRSHCWLRRWSLTPPFHPYWHCQRYVSVAQSGRFPRPGCYPTPCSVECGLSSTGTNPAAIARPTLGSPIIPHCTAGCKGMREFGRG